ncbi:MAG: glycine--tRNA ligase subunit beta [Gammaproteobacteria bacterium]|nr:glycine--tRNA ligase subunit beta [Gammaproteobacteria bacterium]MCP4275184.1 glycine--tRNA ligase subunit beta [Gammaproteobacteria bacterium]MCP4830806.1 glycine--tRNA ligase subunit beta [Gammaproteobacteria bacterium]
MSKTADFLVELGTEELPPKALLKLSNAFAAGIEKGLATARLTHGEILAYTTPRRLAVHVKDLITNQPAQVIESKGPPTRMAYNDDGQPSKAALAFARKCGVDIKALETLKTDKGEWLYFKGEATGKQSATLLGELVNNSLASLPIPKRMRWGANEVEFVRPVHWLVMLLGKDIINANILGLTADRLTYGHRFHAPNAIKLKSPADYVSTLRNKGKVIVDFAERRNIICTAAQTAAKDAGGEALLNPAVVDEVTALVEWPVPVSGSFDKRFLRLPREVLISTLQDHQRYFPVQKAGDLLPAFIATSNLESKLPECVRAGNERVILPRLADAAFFWDKDTKIRLSDRQADLNNVVYQKGLGSLHDKATRVAALATTLVPAVSADPDTVTRATMLARTDLLTDMVGEFPELQGRMGYYYALNDGEPEAIAIAIEEQYLPRQAGDCLPRTPAGQALSLADRLDTLAGIFCLGKRPSGNKDPFSLRRQALGLVRILVESKIDIDLPALLFEAVALQPAQQDKNKVVAELYTFVIDRMRAWYLDGQSNDFSKGDITAEMFEAVRNRAPASPLDFHQRLAAVQQFMGLEAATSLAAANKRIANILKKADVGLTKNIDESLFDIKEEQLLYNAVTALQPDHQADLTNRNYSRVLQRLADLHSPVDGYFDQVMVMDENKQRRSNRLAQLEQLRSLFLDVADISCLQTS